MTTARVPRVRLEAWTEDSMGLLRSQNTPEMTEHLGGPETEEQLLSRHQRYLRLARNAAGDGKGQMLRVVLPGGEVAGTAGYWEREWQGEEIYETGYGILPEYQGRGLAVAALQEVVRWAAAEGKHRYIHAFPSVAHTASNAVCRKAGFELAGQCEFEYPKGHFASSNDWRADLTET
jgi:RimJ/RimL family protein N-acetyltransferase